MGLTHDVSPDAERQYGTPVDLLICSVQPGGSAEDEASEEEDEEDEVDEVDGRVHVVSPVTECVQ